jgi:hypothetical protein
MVGIATSYRLDGPGFVYCQGQDLFSSLKPSILAVGLTQPPVQRIQWFFSWGKSGQGVVLTSQLHLVLRLRMTRAISLPPCMPSWHVHGNFIRNTRVKIELCLCNHEGMLGIGIAALMCNRDTKWRHMLSLMRWLLYPQGMCLWCLQNSYYDDYAIPALLTF